MPDAYQNPNRTPATAGYTWVPKTPKGFGGANAFNGFDNLRIIKGRFLNYTAPIKGDPIITASGKNIKGDLYSLIANAFRPLQNQNISLDVSKNEYVSITQQSTNLDINFVFNEFKRFSCVELEYDLSLDIFDKGVIDDYDTTGLTQEEINEYKSAITEARNSAANGINPTIDVDFSRLGLMLFEAETIDGSTIKFPLKDNNADLSYVPITRFRIQDDEYAVTSDKVTFVFNRSDFKPLNEDRIVENFKVLKNISLKLKDGIKSTSLVLNIKSVKFFEAFRSNFSINQTAKSIKAFSYSLTIQGKYFYRNLNGTYWPQYADRYTPNIHVKLFNPNYATGSPGFSHSASVYFLIICWPFYDPLANFFGFDGPIYRIIVGPLLPILRKVNFFGSGKIAYNGIKFANNTYGNLAVLTSPTLSDQVATLGYKLEGEFIDVESENIYNNDLNGIKKRFEVEINSNLFVDEIPKLRTLYRSKDGAKIISRTYDYQVRNFDQPYKLTVENVETTAKVLLKTLDFIETIQIDKLLSIEPLCLMIMESERPFAMPLIIDKGFWQINATAEVTNINNQFDSKLFFRFFFVPEDFEFDNINQLKTYMATTEFYFDESSTNNILNTTPKKGKPNRLEDLFITCNLNDKKTSYTLTKFINKSLSYSASAFSQKRAKLVVGVYGFSAIQRPFSSDFGGNITPVNYPKIQLYIDSSNFQINSTLTQTLSSSESQIIPFRDTKFDNVNMADFYKPNKITKFYLGGELNNTDEDPYPIYNGKINPGSSAFLNILTIASSNAEYGKFTISVTNINDFRNLKNKIYVDFVAPSSNLSNARIGEGEWIIKLNTLDVPIESQFINYEASIDLFFVDELGNRIANIYQSPYQILSSSNEFNFNIQIPFYIPLTTVQLACRLYIIAYSDDRNPVDLDAINESLEALNLSLGVKVTQFEITEHTIQELLVGQNPSAGGSPSFYEDLPLFTSTIDSPTMWVILDTDTIKPDTIFSNNNGFLITGALYSFSMIDTKAFSRDTEIRWRATLFATSLQTRVGVADDVLSLSSDQDQNSSQIMIAKTDSDEKINLIHSDTAVRFTKENVTATGTNQDLSISDLTGTEPQIKFFNSYMLSLETQSKGNQNTNVLEGTSKIGSFKGIKNQPNTIYTDQQTDFLLNCRHTITIQSKDKLNQQINICGVTQAGFLIEKVTNTYSLYINQNPVPGIVYIIEGPPKETIEPSELETFIYPNEDTDKGLLSVVSDNHQGFITKNNNEAIYVYSIQSDEKDKSKRKDNILYARFRIGNKISNRIELFNFSDYNLYKLGIKESKIYSPFLIDTPSGTFCLFSALGKIWMFILPDIKNINFFKPSVSIVAGTLKTDTSNKNVNDINKVLKNLVDNNKIKYLVESTSDDGYVPFQKASLVHIKVDDFSSNLLVHYYNEKQKVCERLIKNSNSLFFKSRKLE